ncbi:MAG TPA: nitrite/sulfite reductase [Membranihabitans sp.]|nr:nitrite/sulfite reductase [Membranihabitans sp.]
MQSFRTELENPVIQEELLELGQKIAKYKSGVIPEDRFKSLRLARGIYGQRQPGVQMIRIKIPHGELSRKKLARIADVSDRYATGNLHITTRQDIQLHFVKLEDTPQLWEELAQDKITIREACGNTVRNVTGSHLAGVHPDAPFDITSYAQATFEYLVRNPICQDMGRKFKISFSAAEDDDYYSYINDIGLIPKVRIVDGQEVHGFKVLIAGGLGAQPNHADLVHEFLPVDQLIPFTEGLIRAFDRYGERTKRNKARMKYLIKDEGTEGLLRLAAEERKVLPFQSFPLPYVEQEVEPADPDFEIDFSDPEFRTWFSANTTRQKQPGYYTVGLKIHNGDISTEKTRKLLQVMESFDLDDIRSTIHQNFVIRYVKASHLRALFSELKALDLTKLGPQGLGNIVTCPGTDTCNLGIASSMGLATRLTEVLEEEYPHLLASQDVDIKISGCMNACGQHSISAIGFQGMTMRIDKKVAPASQVLLGGRNFGNGEGRFADKVIKVPAKKTDEALRLILNDFLANKEEAEHFTDYYLRQGQDYFYQYLKPLGETSDFQDEWFQDWGREKDYIKAIGVGECASVVIDLTLVLIDEADERLGRARHELELNEYARAIYHTYTAIVHLAKSILIHTDAQLNTQQRIIDAFDDHYGDLLDHKEYSFKELVLAMKEYKPSEEFATWYLDEGEQLKNIILEYQIAHIDAKV